METEAPKLKPVITYDDFAKLDMRVGTIESAEEVSGSEKLLKLVVDFGTEKRQVISGIKKYYVPENLVGKQAVFVTNLEPRMIMGLESQAMIMAAHGEGGEAIILAPDESSPKGSTIS